MTDVSKIIFITKWERSKNKNIWMINENPSAFFLLKNNQQKVHLLLRRKNVVCHFLVRFMHRSRFIITATNFGPFFLCYPKRPIRMLAWTKKTTLNGLWTANRPLGHRFKWIPLEAGNPEGTALLHSRCSMDQFLLCCSYDVTYMDSIPLCFLFSAMNFLVFIPPLRLPFCLNISATKRNISIGYAGQLQRQAWCGKLWACCFFRPLFFPLLCQMLSHSNDTRFPAHMLGFFSATSIFCTISCKRKIWVFSLW